VGRTVVSFTVRNTGVEKQPTGSNVEGNAISGLNHVQQIQIAKVQNELFD